MLEIYWNLAWNKMASRASRQQQFFFLHFLTTLHIIFSQFISDGQLGKAEDGRKYLKWNVGVEYSKFNLFFFYKHLYSTAILHTFTGILVSTFTYFLTTLLPKLLIGIQQSHTCQHEVYGMETLILY